MKKPCIPMAASEPGSRPPRWHVFARLADWLRKGLWKRSRARLRSRIWIILPGKEPDSGQKLVLPFSLARLLRQRALETDHPLEDLLPDLLRAALIEQRPPDPVELAWRSLTDREREVACMIAAGLSNQQIAAQLTITRNTVRSHARQIVRKFGCPNRKSLPDLRAYCDPTSNSFVGWDD